MNAAPARHRHDPVWRGAVLALLASALFGLSTPLVQHVGSGLGPFTTAGLLYAGAALLGAVLVATVAWAADNTVSRALAERDPGQVVMVKAALGASASGLLAVLAGEAAPAWTAVAALLAVGASGYGLSLRFYLLAQRTFGAARTGSVFALAPFLGAMAAVALGDRGWGVGMLAGCAAMLGGVLLHLAESHAHEHAHEALAHEHAHRHDDGHHDHAHDPMPEGAHSHWHAHAPMRHTHAHAPDAHHQHTH
jgi:drug/metabolite transporter (DMT)-like permease